jgi:LacI family transcriptional regulator
MNQPAVTLRDVAKAASVSLATASRAMHANPDKASEKYLHIQKTAEELGYRPDPGMARLIDRRWRGQKAGRGVNLGFIYDTNHPSGLKAEIEYQYNKKRAEELGYALIAENIADFHTESGLLKRLEAHGVEGLILSELPEPSLEIDSLFKKYAAVSLGVSSYQPECPLVAHDEFFCIRAAWRIIEEKGYRRIGQILPIYPESATSNLRMGAALVCRQLTSPKRRIPILFTQEDLSEDYEKILAWIDKYKPDMIMGQTHEWVIELERHGLKLPEDIPFATGNLWEPAERGHIAGYFRDNRVLLNRAILLLNMMIRSGVTGSERADLVELVKGSWVDGKTLPDKS